MTNRLKNILVLIATGPIVAWALLSVQARAENLAQVYQDAVKNDMTLQAAYYNLKQSAEQTPQAWAELLPTINATGAWSYNELTGRNFINGIVTNEDTGAEVLSYGASLKQTVFDFSAFRGLSAAHDFVKSAYATYAYAQQTLMYQVFDAYFKVLFEEDNLRYAESNKEALYENYRQADESFKVGVKTKTDMYQAKAAYESAVSQYIAAKNEVSNAFEALRIITGKRYKKLTPLSPNFKFTHPEPVSITQWVNAAKKNNWDVKSAYYTMEYARDVAKAQWGQHFPRLDLVGQYQKNRTNAVSGPSEGDLQRNSNLGAGLDLTVPILQGGEINSKVREFEAKYQQYAADYKNTDRNAEQSARTNYLQIVTSASQIVADRHTIVSDKLALEGIIEGYRVGTETMLNILDSQQQLYSDLDQYAQDQYNYFVALALLKQSAATLSDRDIVSINSWLTYQGQNQAIDYVANISDVYRMKPDDQISDTDSAAGLPSSLTNHGNANDSLDDQLPANSDHHIGADANQPNRDSDHSIGHGADKANANTSSVDATANIPQPTAIESDNIPQPSSGQDNSIPTPSDSGMSGDAGNNSYSSATSDQDQMDRQVNKSSSDQGGDAGNDDATLSHSHSATTSNADQPGS